MTEVERIRDQFGRSLKGEAWHGPSIGEVLDGISAEMAFAKPVAGAHSVWETVLHISAWQRAALRMLRGESVHLPDAEDWPTPAGTGESEWQAAVAEVRETHAALDAAIAKLDDQQLTNPIPAREYDTYFLLHGIVQHGLYHAGQIALLKKALTQEPRRQ